MSQRTKGDRCLLSSESEAGIAVKGGLVCRIKLTTGAGHGYGQTEDAKKWFEASGAGRMQRSISQNEGQAIQKISTAEKNNSGVGCGKGKEGWSFPGFPLLFCHRIEPKSQLPGPFFASHQERVERLAMVSLFL